MSDSIAILLILAVTIALKIWVSRRYGRGHLGVDRSVDHHLSEHETRGRHPF